MADRVKDVVAGLKRLSRGRGLQAPDLAAEFGAVLVEVLELDLEQPAVEVRRQAQNALIEAAQAMKSDMRFVALSTLGVDGWFHGPQLQDRIGEIARRLDRDARTIRRRIDGAFTQMADALIARRAIPREVNPNAPLGWHVDSLHSTLRLDAERPSLTEERVVVAEEAGLKIISTSLSVPRPDGQEPAELNLTADHGCDILGTRRVSDSHWRYQLELPWPLRAGERHRYVVTFSVASREQVQPFYVLTPYRRVRTFSLETLFGMPPAADLVWRLDGVPSSILRDGQPTDDVVGIQPGGRAEASFENLVQGLSYGLAWRWRD
jgi:hypothetical protein